MRYLFAILLLLAGSANAATTYYVATTGLAGNTGLSPASPWPLDYALANCGASNTVIAAAGTYSGSFAPGFSGVNLQSSQKWGARLVANPVTLPTFSFWPAAISNCVIDGFEITGSSIHSGVYSVANGCTTRNCWIHHNGTNAPGSMGIEAHDLTGTVVEYNLVEYNGAVAGSLGNGIYMNGTNCVIRGNVVRYNYTAGIQFYRDPGDNPAEGSLNGLVYNNLVYGNSAYACTFGSLYTRVFYLFNNTICQTNGTTLIYIGHTGNGCIVDATNNVFCYSGCSFKTGDGTLPGDHNQTNGVPLFCDTTKGLFWLTASSPARGAANTTIVPPVDFFGNMQTAITDIGAFQYYSIYAGDTRVLDPSAAAGADYWALLSHLTRVNALKVVIGK